MSDEGKREAEGVPEGEHRAQRARLQHVQQDRRTSTRGTFEFDVSEVFSRPRVTTVAKEAGWVAGYSLDQVHQDQVTSRTWDLLSQRDQNALYGLLRSRPSKLVVVSPPCRTFSSLQCMRKHPLPQQEKENGIELLRVAIKTCLIQMKVGGYFILEHPAGASSWQDEEMVKLMSMKSVQVLTIDQCEYGLRASDSLGDAPAKKTTKLITNMSMASVTLARRCSGQHRHVHLVNGRAAAAEVYPRELCQAMVETLHLELKMQEHFEKINADTILSVDAEDLHEPFPIQVHGKYDEITGVPLDPVKVAKGRAKELEKMRDRKVFELLPKWQADRDPEGKYIRTRWVETEKNGEVRSRFVACEIAAGDPREDLFAGTPPLQAARTLVSMAATIRPKPWKLMVLDVSCAFLYAECVRRLYIELPEAQQGAHGEKLVGLLRKALYGTRDAPQLWAGKLREVLEKLGFVASQLHPGVFHHPARQIYLCAHVDDLLLTGPESELLWAREHLAVEFELKGDILKEGEMVKYLGRHIEMTQYGYTWSADPKHAEIFKKELGLTHANPCAVPIGTEDHRSGEDAEPMDREDATLYRRLAARLNYLSQDRPDLCVVSNMLSRTMSCPRVADFPLLKKVGRYLVGAPVCKLEFRYQADQGAVTVYSDSDWAGCRVTRRSTTGYMVFRGSHLLSFATRVQKGVALSSAEAELTAQCAGVTDGLSIRNLLVEIGIGCRVESRCDSSAAKAIIQRIGVGKLRHLEVKHLWLQSLPKDIFESRWIAREQNCADALTHAVGKQGLITHWARAGLKFPAETVYSPAEGGCWT